jgi:Peptidase family C78
LIQQGQHSLNIVSIKPTSGLAPQKCTLCSHIWAFGEYEGEKWGFSSIVLYVRLTFGDSSTILDFDRPTGTNNSHDAMFDWIQSYFEEGCSGEGKLTEADARQQHAGKHAGRVVHITNRPPIYLQHSGHSRTIIGIEILSDGRRNLVMFDPGRRMARSYKKNVSVPEDDMYNSGLLSLNNDEENTSADTPAESEELPDGWLFKMRNLFTVPASNLLRPFRVDSNTIASNPQYQLLVLGEVNELRAAAPTHQCLSWNPNKSFLLSSEEREQNKKIGSFRVV